jgi:hypothetical protein
MPATRAQSVDMDNLVHPRGFAVSSVFTCPVCSHLVHAYRLNLQNGVKLCPQCHTHFKVGINLFILPRGPRGAYNIAPDESLPASERTRMGLRRRSRQRRAQYLAELSLADPVPTIACNRFLGQPINSVTVVSEPVV